MIIKKAEIRKFRGFEDLQFDLGTQITVIAGQNGTQKTTILGLLSQPFTITDKDNPMREERPLSGGSFKSAFSEKFKLSEQFDQPKSHEWTLHLEGQESFTIESIPRSKKGNEVRFWKKGDREKGSGYIQLPVIFLSLQRLLPIGEDASLAESDLHTLSSEEIVFFKKWHKKILISMDEISGTNYLASSVKNTLGINTTQYDWPLNSAGQDNIGKILLSVISFMRLQNNYPDHYKGGILAIDELDAVLYPVSEVQLFNALRTFASKFKLQIIFTTHSLTILEHALALCTKNSLTPSTSDQLRVLYLEKFNGRVKIRENISMASIRHRLNVAIDGDKPLKLLAFTEDKEAETFVKAIIKSRASKLSFFGTTFGCSSLVELGTKKIPSFSSPESVVFLDGDVRTTAPLLKKIKRLPNFLILPGEQNPERLLADFLFNLPDDSEVWTSIHADYTKQICFRNAQLDEIRDDRQHAKRWFNEQSVRWGRNAAKVINPWIDTHQAEVDEFIANFKEIYNKFAEELNQDPL